MLNSKRLVIAMLMLLVATTAMASTFRAADTIYLPAAGRLAGGNNTFFKTDVFLSNLSTERVIVQVAFISGTAGDADGTAAGKLQSLAVLLPGERREVNDIMKAVFNLDGPVLGQLVFFACKENGNCTDCGTNPADCELISVEARIYTQNTDGSTFGQLFPGIPWYDYVSAQAIDPGHRTVFITGVRQFGTRGVSGYRSNIGLTNASQFTSTVLRLRAFTGTGTQIGDAKDISLGPLGHTQQNVSDLFPTFSGTGYITVEQTSWTLVPGANAADELAAFMAYGSVLDNKTNDPTTLEAQFPIDMSLCVYNASSKTIKRPVRRH